MGKRDIEIGLSFADRLPQERDELDPVELSAGGPSFQRVPNQAALPCIDVIAALQSTTNNCFCFLQDAAKMILSTEALGVNLVDILRP